VATANEIIDQQRDIYERMRNPSEHTLEYFKAFAEDTLAKDEDRYMGMFYPYDVARSGQAAIGFCNEVSVGIRDARAYQVTSNMVETIDSAHKNSAKVIKFVEAELPCRAGFVYLDKPVEVVDDKGVMSTFRAVSWQPISCRMQDGVVTPGIRIIVWASLHDGSDYNDSFDERTIAYADANLGTLTVQHIACIPFDLPFARPEGGGSVAWMHSMWMFMDMEIVSEKSRVSPVRGVRRRAAKLGSQDVTVITMRRTKHTPYDTDHTPQHIDWSCRWIVQGHIRHLPTGKTTWVRPYIKGPDGAPIRDTAKLYRLSR
jgi:hypothetical protein